jgi:hypothetical protein
VWTQILNDQGTSARLVSARPDGSGLRALTHPGPKQFDINAVISPDGSQIAFERDPTSGPAVVGLIGATGRGEHIVPVRCASPCAGVLDPGWTPSGQQIVFSRVIGPFDGPGHLPPARHLHPRHPLRHPQRRRPRHQLQPVLVPGRETDRLHQRTLLPEQPTDRRHLDDPAQRP